MDEINKYYDLTRKAFNTLAPFYNLMTLPLAKVREQVVDLTSAKKGSTVLDVATGTGQQALAFGKRGYDVTGVDLTEAMLDIARKHNQAGLVKFEVADATRLRFENESFDVSCVSFALHDMPATIREQVLKEMVRVTKLQGVIVIVDYDLPHNTVGKLLIYRLVTLYEGKYYKQFITSDVGMQLQKAGIKIIMQRSVLLGAGKILIGTKNF